MAADDVAAPFLCAFRACCAFLFVVVDSVFGVGCLVVARELLIFTVALAERAAVLRPCVTAAVVGRGVFVTASLVVGGVLYFDVLLRRPLGPTEFVSLAIALLR